MLQFLSEDVRAAFHSLSIDKQREWVKFAEEVLRHGKLVNILYVSDTPEALEISVRIDEKFDVASVGSDPA